MIVAEKNISAIHRRREDHGNSRDQDSVCFFFRDEAVKNMTKSAAAVTKSHFGLLSGLDTVLYRHKTAAGPCFKWLTVYWVFSSLKSNQLAVCDYPAISCCPEIFAFNTALLNIHECTIWVIYYHLNNHRWFSWLPYAPFWIMLSSSVAN
jgi:hypothetical protein